MELKCLYLIVVILFGLIYYRVSFSINPEDSNYRGYVPFCKGLRRRRRDVVSSVFQVAVNLIG